MAQIDQSDAIENSGICDNFPKLMEFEGNWEN